MGEMIEIDTGSGKVPAYIARPDGPPCGGVLLIHEVWGLVDHTSDVADRLAREGYTVLAPELLGDVIDTVAAGELQEDLFNPEKRNATQPRLRELMTPMHNPAFGEDTVAKLQACFDYLHSQPETHEKIAAIGFCFGGTYSFSLAVSEPRLALAVPFYGHSGHSALELRAIKCPVRAFYGEKDESLMQTLPELQEKMREAGVDFEATVYPDCGHAFFNDTNKFAYNAEAAADAWQRVLKYLQTYVG